jgi:hypothetical protein
LIIAGLDARALGGTIAAAGLLREGFRGCACEWDGTKQPHLEENPK